MPTHHPFPEEEARTWLSKEVKYIMAFVGVFISVATPFYALRQDVAVIKANIANINGNHEQHIQDLNQNLKEALELIKAQQQQIVQLQEQQALLNQSVKYLQQHQ